MKHIVSFSGGVGSWLAAKRVVAQHGAADVTLLFTDTLIEDPDLYRFLDEAAADVGAPLVRIADGRTPFDVFRDVRFLGNTRVDACSRVLKREPADTWLAANCDPAQTVVYVGIDWTEEHRYTRLAARKAESGWAYRAPLCEAPFLSKPQMFEALAAAGIRRPRLYDLSFAHNNCFVPSTRFLTDRGVMTLGECVGKQVRVLGHGGRWHDATVESFGIQPTVDLVVSHHGHKSTVTTTAGHRWPVRDRPGRTSWRLKTTAELREGDAILSMHSRLEHNVRPSAVGIAAGFTFGDGTHPKPKGQNSPVCAYLCGDKDAALLPYFPAMAHARIGYEGKVMMVDDLPHAWKQLPPMTESKSYLYGWLAGLFAADGSFGKSAEISTASLQTAHAIRDVATAVGIGAGRVRTEMRKGFGDAASALHSVSLTLSTLREDFFVIDAHRAKFLAVPKANRAADHIVRSVSPTGRTEQVVCAVVPDGHMFTLDDNMYTSNCGGGCVKAGQAHWALLLRTLPDVYARWEGEEDGMRAMLGADIAILRDRTGGVSKPLTLRAFRERVQAGQCFDLFEWGGCGCFVDEPEVA